MSINQAREQGACAKEACKQVGINPRTYHRWRKDPLGDQRKGPVSTPANKLTEDERCKVLQMANSKEFADQPPSQIVPQLAERGEYVASESSFYRILKAENSGRVDALKWVKRFVLWYNEVHRHSGIKFVTPGSRHRGEDKKILNHRR